MVSPQYNYVNTKLVEVFIKDFESTVKSKKIIAICNWRNVNGSDTFPVRTADPFKHFPSGPQSGSNIWPLGASTIAGIGETKRPSNDIMCGSNRIDNPISIVPRQCNDAVLTILVPVL